MVSDVAFSVSTGLVCLCRVIALAWKKLDAELTPSQVTALSREEIECGLTFGGFAVFHCPLKEDSEPALRMLKVSTVSVGVCAMPHPQCSHTSPSSAALSCPLRLASSWQADL